MDRWHSLFIHISYNVEVVVSFGSYRLVAAVQAVHARPHHPTEHLEHSAALNLGLVRLPLLPRLPSLCLLHAFDEVPQKLMRVLLPAEFELHRMVLTFLKMILRWLIILLGENLLESRVLL